MKYLLILLLLTNYLVAMQKERLIIDAQKFESYNSENLSIFTGNVTLKKNQDTLSADKIEIYIQPKEKNKKREILKYIATGNTTFEIVTKDKHYKGKGDKIIYNKTIQEYQIIGKASIKEINEDKTLLGEKIILNQKTSEAKVIGTKKKPIRFIMEIQNKSQ